MRVYTKENMNKQNKRRVQVLVKRKQQKKKKIKQVAIMSTPLAQTCLFLLLSLLVLGSFALRGSTLTSSSSAVEKKMLRLVLTGEKNIYIYILSGDGKITYSLLISNLYCSFMSTRYRSGWVSLICLKVGK